MRMFIVDDSSLLRREIKSLLSEIVNLPVEVVGEAENVEDAKRGIMELKPHVVILDIQLPEGNGIDVLQAIMKKNPCLSVIVTTNFPTFQHRVRCLSLGAYAFLDKHKEVGKIPEILFRIDRKIRMAGGDVGAGLNMGEGYELR